LIRRWRPQDFQTIKEICEETTLFTPFFGESHYRKVVETHRKRKPNPLGELELLVAEVGGRVVGVVFAFRQLVVGSVVLLAVHPHYQGRGIGSMLLDKVCERLKRRMARLMVIFGDPRAKAGGRGRLIEFYKRHGFKALGMMFVKRL
jgi:predicted N-acetyltransferase YhbS